MGWWSSVGDGAKAMGNGLLTAANWIWENASITKITTGIVTYATNTLFQSVEQLAALRTAVPTLINNPEARKVVNGMAYVAFYDVLPLVALNAANNGMQNYFRAGSQEDAAWYGPYSLFLSGLTLANYAVTAFTWRQGAQSFSRMLILDSLGPPAFNSNKKLSPESLCTELDCTTKRKMKGWGREPLVLLANDALTWGISRVPYIGPPISKVLGVYFIGRYMTRLATPERCERHKEMMQESVLSLGLSYTATTWLMDMFLEATTGMPPYLYYRTMRHLLLLLHVNVASHMNLPRGLPKDATAYVDPLNIYERITRFIADVIFEGLKVRVPIDFKLEEGAKPLIPLSTALKLGTKILNSDKPVLNPEKPGFFKQSVDTLRVWVLPPMFQSADGLINDRIISDHWPSIQMGAVDLIKILSNVGKNNKISATLVATATWVPGSTEVALEYKWGVPRVVTRYGLRLSKKEDFWDFADALKGWFERHSVKFEVVLDEKPQLPLLGDKPIAELPKDVDPTPVTSAVQLVSEKSKVKSDIVSNADELIPRKAPVINLLSTNPYSLLTARKKDTTPVSSMFLDDQNLKKVY